MEALHFTGGNATVLKIQDDVESLNKIQYIVWGVGTGTVQNKVKKLLKVKC